MAEDDDKITIEIKITIPTVSRNLGRTIEHILNATEEIVKAGKAAVAKPEVKARVRKVEVK
ncbi:MAG: hypothetical protein QXU18_06565 [Thermoplasmatales archaeon]